MVVGVWLNTAGLMEIAASDAIPRRRAQLIVLCGNSGAGKSTVARELRAELDHRVAIVQLSDGARSFPAPDLRFHVAYMCGTSS